MIRELFRALAVAVMVAGWYAVLLLWDHVWIP